MIVGIGIDIVDLRRFADALAGNGFSERVFSPAELKTAPQQATPARNLEYFAGRFAAKEALAKALGAPGGLNWKAAELFSRASGCPEFALSSSVKARADLLGTKNVLVSITHDAGVAAAVVVLEG
ncbi:MAG: holo-ACP synthase [Propionibacteriaceae bacterium]|jgi:holo-[acyl-carrier protein] synthase|nr:holo-ACP synthase [Propionibacteriaceae bacterium]